MSRTNIDPTAPSARPFELTRQHQLYLFLVALFVTCLLVADIVAGKYFDIGGVEMSVGTVAFPIAFLLTDIVNEYDGQSGARLMTGIGMSMLVIGFGIIVGARLLPVAAMSPIPQPAFDAVFGLSSRLFGASLLAYLISQYLDIYAFHLVKRVTASRHLWLRAIGSTALSQIIDTVFVNFGANVGLRSLGDIASITVDSYLYKLVVAVALTPLCYLAHEIITGRMGIPPVPHEARGAGIPT